MKTKIITSGFHSLFWSIDEQIEELENLKLELDENGVDTKVYEDKLCGIIADLADIKNVFRGYK